MGHEPIPTDEHSFALAAAPSGLPICWPVANTRGRATESQVKDDGIATGILSSYRAQHVRKYFTLHCTPIFSSAEGLGVTPCHPLPVSSSRCRRSTGHYLLSTHRVSREWLRLLNNACYLPIPTQRNLSPFGDTTTEFREKLIHGRDRRATMTEKGSGEPWVVECCRASEIASQRRKQKNPSLLTG